MSEQEERPTRPDHEPWAAIEGAYRQRDQAKEEAESDADAESPAARGERRPRGKRATDGPL